MKTLTMLIAAVLLTGCSDYSAEEPRAPQEIKFNMPEGLKDCKVYHVTGPHDLSMIMARCPNSDTSTRYGKYGRSITTEQPTEEEEETP